MGTNNQITVPFLNIPLQDSPLQQQLSKLFLEVYKNGMFIKGPLLETFEKEFATYIGTKYCIGVASGTDALHLSLKSLGIGKGDEVILPANTFAATAYAVIYTGATPIFVDINPHTYNIDVLKTEQAISKKTRAIIPVHLYGQAAEMDKIMAIAKKHNLFVVEDAAQAHGATFKSKNIGTFGDLAIFSFYPGKNLGAYGDAGAVLTNSLRRAKKVKALREYGGLLKYEYNEVGFNSRMDSLQAGILSAKLKKLNKWNKLREKAARYYTDKFQQHLPFIITPDVNKNSSHVYHLYVIKTKKRNQLAKYLNQKGIEIGIHYPIPLHLQKSLAFLKNKKGDFPVTEQLCNEILSLPLFPDITIAQQDYVVETIQSFYKK